MIGWDEKYDERILEDLEIRLDRDRIHAEIVRLILSHINATCCTCIADTLNRGLLRLQGELGVSR
jgi:hypothetical protein